MAALRDRKTRLTFETDQELRYLGKLRAIVVQPNPWFCAVRLKGTRVVYEIAWETIFTRAAQIFAEKQREERRACRGKKAA